MKHGKLAISSQILRGTYPLGLPLDLSCENSTRQAPSFLLKQNKTIGLIKNVNEDWSASHNTHKPPQKKRECEDS